MTDSIAEIGWDIDDQAERYLKWWQTGAHSVNGRCFDIRNTTIAALHRFQQSGDARTSADPSEHASGNGSIIRLAPVPIRYCYMFPDGIGDDADTTGAVCGQLAGACWGEPGIPVEWRKELARGDMIEGALSGLLGG